MKVVDRSRRSEMSWKASFGQLPGTDSFEQSLGGDRSYVYMTSTNLYEESGENGTGMTLSQIVIEAEGLGNSGLMLCLRVDTQLIARNLTTAQIQFLICEILDRIEKEPKAVGNSCTDISPI